MGKILRSISLIFLLAIGTGGVAKGGMDLGISLGDEGLRSFYLAVGNYYRVPEKEVAVVKKRKVSDEAIPVVFFISQRANVSPDTVLRLRLGGASWLDITLRFGLSPEIYYVPVKAVKGPPFGKAYGHYKNKPRKKWKSIVLKDDDIINFVNLRFISEHYGFTPDEIIKMRSSGKDFILIHSEVKKKKKGHGGEVAGKKVRKKHTGKGKK